jgi:hypothetical protein
MVPGQRWRHGIIRRAAKPWVVGDRSRFVSWRGNVEKIGLGAPALRLTLFAKLKQAPTLFVGCAPSLTCDLGPVRFPVGSIKRIAAVRYT